MLNIIGFSNYFALIGLMIIPLIWFIIRSSPPVPKKFNFSSFYLLEEVNQDSTKKNATPLWLLIFRILFFILLILFLSKPYFKNNENLISKEYDKYVILADIGWSMASNWLKFKDIINKISKEAEDKKKSIVFHHSGLESIEKPKVFKSSQEINLYLESLSPIPLQFKKNTLANFYDDSALLKNSKLFLVSSKYDFVDFAKHLNNFDSIKNNANDSIIINPIKNLLLINNLETSRNMITIEIGRLGENNFIQKFQLKATTFKNEVIYSEDHIIEENINKIIVKLNFPIEIINQIKKIEIVGQDHAAAKYYFDDYSKKRNIAILSNDNLDQEPPLLSSYYYISKSLNDSHLINIGQLDDLIKNNNSVIIIPDKTIIPEKLYNNLNNWLLKGGTLIRFAELNLIKQSSKFLTENNSDIIIRYHDRNLNIKKNMSISTFDKNSIFYGLKTPNDFNISKQLLFRSTSKDTKIIAKLNDNTPLVSIKNIGNGKIILFHVSANTSWSDLPLSSLFPDMLNRLLLFSKNQNSQSLQNLSLSEQINGFGNLELPKNIINIEKIDKIKQLQPSYITPPGIYENNGISVAINLSTKINNVNYQFLPKNTIQNYLYSDRKDLSKIILIILLAMFILDILITIILKNKIKIFKTFSSKKNIFTFIFLFLISMNSFNLYSKDFSNNTYLAYVKIKDDKINKISKNGLTTIKNLLSTRTSVTPYEVVGLNIKNDDIFYYPLIYWPLTKNLIKISDTEKKKIRNYLNNGGIIFFDIIGFSRETFDLKNKKFKNIKDFLNNIEITNLSLISKNHTLTKSFYLLKKFPGRWDNRVLLVESKNLEYKDGVNSVIIGFNDWAAAWALGDNNLPLYPVVPGGDRQRELAYRFGINIVMYSLTGNYKSDQIHSKSILNRLSKPN